jgi:hypothetical protein
MSRDMSHRSRLFWWLPHPNFPIGTLSGYAGAFILVSARQTLPMSSASTAGQFDGDSTSSNEPTPNAPGTWPRSASVVKPLARSGNCWNARAMLRLRLRSSKPSEPSEPKRGDKSPMPTSNGSTLRRTCQVVLVLRQLVSYESAIPMALVVSGSSAPRLRPYSTTAGCSTNEGPNRHRKNERRGNQHPEVVDRFDHIRLVPRRKTNRSPGSKRSEGLHAVRCRAFP